MTIELGVLLVIAGVNLVTVIIMRDLKSHVVRAAMDILRVEKATNSMKDALVTATAKASLSEGLAQGRAEATNAEQIKRESGNG